MTTRDIVFFLWGGVTTSFYWIATYFQAEVIILAGLSTMAWLITLISTVEWEGKK